MENLYIMRTKEKYNDLTEEMINKVSLKFNVIKFNSSISPAKNKLLFPIELDHIGMDFNMLNLISKIYERDNNAFKGSSGILIVNSSTEFYTKRFSQYFIYLLNSFGCRFIGHPLIEANPSLLNFKTWQKTLDIPLKDICLLQSERLGKRFYEYNPVKIQNPNILVLYSKLHKRSNTYDFYKLISDKLHDCHIDEINIENGKINDCRGCSYNTCIHFGEKSSCFYGGIMVESVLPKIEKADAVIWICPNYNDSITANLTALINRLTVLYNKMPFYEKSLFSVIVSGNSGSDSIANQLIGSLNINKGFSLPPNAFAMATANDPLSIYDYPDIYNIADEFSKNIMMEIKK
jgi:multimeric flavodoxin WrbA